METPQAYLCVWCRTPEEFSSKLAFAMKHEPKPMRAEERERLTWEAATERFLDVAELKGEERATKVSAAVDTLAFNLYNYLTGILLLLLQASSGSQNCLLAWCCSLRASFVNKWTQNRSLS